MVQDFWLGFEILHSDFTVDLYVVLSVLSGFEKRSTAPEEVTSIATESEMPEEQLQHCSGMNTPHITPLERITNETNDLPAGTARDGLRSTEEHQAAIVLETL